jgi:hypothetical protein
MLPRVPCDDWPRVLCPAPGKLPLATPLRGDERVMNIGMACATDTQIGQKLALASMAAPGGFRDLAWNTPFDPIPHICAAADEIRPTLVWMQLQGPSLIHSEGLAEIRNHCDPSVVVVNWDGDQHFEPHEAGRAWFRELSGKCDANLVANTQHPYQYAAMGMRGAGFLGPGSDHLLWRPTEPTSGTPAIVALANHWPTLNYDRRNSFFGLVAKEYPGDFGIYGRNWEQYPGMPGRPYLNNEEEAGVYSAARAALSISIRNDLDRYTSNRLPYALCTGTVVLVERFLDCEGWGLVDGVNCLIWDGWNELKEQLDRILRTRPEDWMEMRAAGRELGCLHSWDTRMMELQAIVDVIRSGR